MEGMDRVLLEGDHRAVGGCGLKVPTSAKASTHLYSTCQGKTLSAYRRTTGRTCSHEAGVKRENRPTIPEDNAPGRAECDKGARGGRYID